MRKLQNNFTTPEQSKRLLELGVPADSADCYNFGVEIRVRNYPYELAPKYVEVKYIPCWTVGRLIEISELCFTSLLEQDFYIKQKDCNTDYLIKMFELCAHSMDFSKLLEEEK